MRKWSNQNLKKWSNPKEVIIDFHVVDLPNTIYGPDTKEGSLVQKVCGVLHLRLLQKDDIYPKAELL